MENRSLLRGQGQPRSNGVPEFPVRCPSCAHANPARSHYCNQCGMPVHFEECDRCYAINLRGAASCYKCGCVLGVREATVPPPVVVESSPSQPPAVTDSPVVLPVDDANAHAQPRRSAGVRVVLIAFGVAMVAVPTYIATERPASFDRLVDAIAPRADVAAEAPAPVSASPGAHAQPSERIDAPPAPTATSEAGAPPKQEAAGAPPPEIAHELKSSNAAVSAPPRAHSKSPRASTTKSGASRSKQGTSPRKPATRKPAPKLSWSRVETNALADG